MSFSFNLVDEAWIPCILPDGRTTEHLSIKETLLRAHELREVCDPSPLVTVSLHRLLLAVLYRALAPLENKDQWIALWQAERFPADRVESYLDQWQERFDLFSDEHPFYQVPGLTTDQPAALSRLAAERASGHNPTLFDHRTDGSPAAYSAAEAARLLLAVQSHAVGGGQSRVAHIGTGMHGSPNFEDAVIAKGCAIWLAGESLWCTLMLGLVPYQQSAEAIACWEASPEHTLSQVLASWHGGGHAPLGSIDAYTSQSRLARLIPEAGNTGTTVRYVYLTQGKRSDGGAFDPMQAYRKDLSRGYVVISLDSGKAIWRDIHSLIAAQATGGKQPGSVRFVAELVHSGIVERKFMHDVNVVGLAKSRAKILLWRHDRVPIPAALLDDQDLMGYLAGAIQCAEDMANKPWGLQRRMERVCRLFAAPAADRPGGRAPRREDIAPLLDSLNPQRSYWSRLEEPFYQFLQDLPDDPDGASERWLDAVEIEARRSFREACRALGTSARAIRAVASVSDYFRVPGRPEHEIAAEPTQPQERR
jgi:CRISPR system Cascade subunit CasA